MGLQRKASGDPHWLFGDPSNPLLSVPLFDRVEQMLDPAGRRILWNYRTLLVERPGTWNSPSIVREDETLGIFLRGLLQDHIDAPKGTSHIDVPDLFLGDLLTLDALPISSGLLYGLKRSPYPTDTRLRELDGLTIRSLIEFGLQWKEILELIHLMDWLPAAEVAGVSALPRENLGVWGASMLTLLAYRTGQQRVGLSEALTGRFGIATDLMTLEQAGDLIGVTRERFRQIERAVRRFAAENPLAPPGVLEELINDPNSITDLLPGWTKKGLRNLLILSGLWGEREAKEVSFQSNQELALSDPRVSKLVKESAGTMGFINKAALVKRLLEEVGLSTPIEPLVEEILSVVGRSGKWLLVRKGKQSQGESAILGQLKLGQSMSGRELFDGLARKAKSRSANWQLPPFDEAVQLIRSMPDIVETEEGFQLCGAKHKELTGHIGWMLQMIQNSEHQCLSVEEMVRLGLKAGFRPSTTAQYARTLDFLRSKNNMVWAAASPPSEAQMQAAVRQNELFENETSLEFDGQTTEGGLLTELTIGTVFLRSSQVVVPKALASALGEGRRRLTCSCGKDAPTPIRVSKRNLRGTTWLRNHLLLEHFPNLGIADQPRVRIEFKDSEALLWLSG